MVKISDIAKMTGFSTTTVSKAFNNYSDISEKTRNIIIEKANELGYIPNAQARGLVMKRSFTIGVVLDELFGLGFMHPFFSGIIQHFREAIESLGYSMILISNSIGVRNIVTYYDHCRQRNVDGVFILCSDLHDPHIQEVIHSDIPTVLFDTPNNDAHCVLSNHYEGAYNAVKYLVERNHTKIAHIYGNELTYAGKERKRGYEDAMKYYNLEINSDYIVSGGYFDFKYSKKAMKELLDLKNQPSAVFASGDIMALGAVQECYERRVRIPEDISIIGFDNIKLLDWITPALTTIAQDIKAIGQSCCTLLDEAIRNKEMKVTKKVIKTHLYERNSCATVK